MFINIIILNIIQWIGIIYNHQIYETIYWYNGIGIDTLTISLIWLITIIYPFIYSLEKPSPYWILLYILLIISFSTYNILYFYIYFELLIFPLFFIIGIYGSRYLKIEASYRLLIWTLFGSFVFLIPLSYVYYTYGTFNISIIPYLNTELNVLSKWLGIFFILPFLIKLPIYPFFSWLPYAHTEANTAGSIILAALILKLAPLGIIRFLLPYGLLSSGITIYLISLATLTLIICIPIIFNSIDLKKIIAYSSIVHMNLSFIGILIFNYLSIMSAYLSIFSHALISTALFLSINFIYIRFNTRSILYLRGLSNIFPIFVLCLSIFMFFNIGFPFSFSFLTEFLLLLSIYYYSPILTYIISIVLMLFSLIFVYFLIKIIFGQLTNYILFSFDMYLYEFLPFFFLFILVVLFGLFPTSFISYLTPNILFLDI